MLTIQQAAAQLGVSVRRVQALCAQKRIKGARKAGPVWVLPNKLTIKPGSRGPHSQRTTP